MYCPIPRCRSQSAPSQRGGEGPSPDAAPGSPATMARACSRSSVCARSDIAGERAVLADQLRILEHRDEHGSREEPADVRPERYPTLALGRTAAQELQQEPVAEHDVRRHHDPRDEDEQEDQHVDPYARIQDDV